MKRLLIATLFVFAFQPFSQGQVLISLLLGDKLNSDGLEFGLVRGFNWIQISGLESSEIAAALI